MSFASSQWRRAVWRLLGENLRRSVRLRRAAPGRDPLRPASRRQRIVRIAGIALVAVAICAYLDQFTLAFDYIEQKAHAERLKVSAIRNGSMAERAREQIVLVTLSDDSFDPASRGHLVVPEPPVPRSYHAKIIRELTRAGAKVIAFDLLFHRPKPGDLALAEAARESGRVLWACSIPSPGLDLPVPALLQASRHYGHTRVPINGERPIIDRIEPVIRNGGALVPAFSLEAARMALGGEDEPLRPLGRGWRVGTLEVPVGKDGAFKIRFLNAPGKKTFQELPYELIYHGRSATDPATLAQNRAWFADKIVLIGDTSGRKDYRMTPEGGMAGVEIHAHAVATLLAGGLLREAPLWAEVLLLCVLATLVCLLDIASWRLWFAALSAVLLLPAYCLFNVWLFVDHDISLPMIAPCALIAVTALAVFIERGLTEECEKTRMRGLLQRYVSPQIAQYVIDHPEKCILGGQGELVTATVLFSDIRGFTELSGRIAPEELVARLNEYFEAMTDVIFRHDGAAARYIGDAIMAIFGAPVPHPDHARRAVAAAIEMQRVLLRLQEQWRARGLPVLDIGIGINTGEMVAGVVGGRQQMDFTVYGYAVNLASRVEDLNKELGSRILITESTYQRVQGQVAARGPIPVLVKGMDKQVVLYEIQGWRDPSAAAPRSADRAAS